MEVLPNRGQHFRLLSSTMMSRSRDNDHPPLKPGTFQFPHSRFEHLDRFRRMQAVEIDHVVVGGVGGGVDGGVAAVEDALAGLAVEFLDACVETVCAEGEGFGGGFVAREIRFCCSIRKERHTLEACACTHQPNKQAKECSPHTFSYILQENGSHPYIPLKQLIPLNSSLNRFLSIPRIRRRQCIPRHHPFGFHQPRRASMRDHG